MNKYIIYIGANIVAEIETRALLSGNDKMALKILWGNLHNADFSGVEIVENTNNLVGIAREAARKCPAHLGASPKIAAIKAIKEAAGYNLAEAKAYFEANKEQILIK